MHSGGSSAPWRTRLAALRTRHLGITDCGLVRARNEDTFLIDERLGLFIVCDGVGGRAHGEVAAAATVESVWEHLRREVTLNKPGADRGGWLEGVMRAALQHASRVVYELAASDRRFTGMSTTASAVLVAGELAVIGHVGDSRVYHARGGAVRQLTEDHTWTLSNSPVRVTLSDVEIVGPAFVEIWLLAWKIRRALCILAAHDGLGFDRPRP